MNQRTIIGIIVLLSILLAVVEMIKPQPIDWETTFSKDDKIPYGTFLLYERLADLFPAQPIEAIYEPVYNHIDVYFDQFELLETDAGNWQYDIEGNTNYIFLNNDFALDEFDTDALLEFVEVGNHAFIGASALSGAFKDTLQLDIRWGNFGFFMPDADSIGFNYVHDTLQLAEPYYFKKSNVTHYFADFDSLHTTVLGYNDEDKVNFIKTDFGKGAFFIHAAPHIFSNYHIVHDNHAEYISKALSHLPPGKVYWDEFYKVGRLEAQTPFRYFLSTAPLKYALYLSLFAIILFVIFEAKRRQRIIPVIEPVQNTTIEFTKAVGMLYYRHQDHKNMADKKINYFLDYLRRKLFFKKIEFTAAFYEKVAHKSGVSLEKVTRLFKKIEALRQKNPIIEAELLRLNELIEDFYAEHQK